ncbi:DNA repair RAD52-like protein 1, mitochondrial isoform B [Glycine soja]|uniref:DNA repair RAD52-like protein 1, mitochondrial isoform B n=1 Tax=Glycine soja TaxID=3848 RepID=A0A445J5D4_GLYSO|nr:DNA repair RAD52-like protein 1, mitochondrial isoform B [Glycine soja]
MPPPSDSFPGSFSSILPIHNIPFLNHLSICIFSRHVVNRILNLHAPEWSGEVRNITYSADAKSVSVVYRVTLYGTDAEIFRESTGTASVDDTSYGDPVQKAEAMAFRRACARFGLGLHLYHEDAS